MHSLSRKLLSLIEAAAPQLAQVDDSTTTSPVRAGGWSRRQLLGHLIDSASNNHQRIVRASLQRELNFPGYDQNGNIRVQQFQTASWAMLVDLFLAYNRLLAHVIAHIPEAKLQTVCKIGAEMPTTLEHLAKDYVKHLAHHLKLMGIEPEMPAAA
ncbi:DinB superfamily protein [Bryocella elongata]|uniref:DinB superfamily protein n=1 Tax=Bryocella elongata TaxID=863522 RepID=A0A1H5WIS2_9BACT|nr:DinB family protein [Bryocella elongata]SEF99364.1 DinB superfamily protein [Bryocella elongata]